MAKEEKKGPPTIASSKVVQGIFSFLCLRCSEKRSHAVLSCVTNAKGHCIVVAQCTVCGEDGKFTMAKRAMSCFDRAKGVCPRWRPPKEEKDEEDTAPKKGEGKKIGFFARLFGR